MEIKKINFSDSSFPPLLKEIPDPPADLFLIGDVSLLSKPAIAVVGTRKATSEGLRTAERFSRAFVKTGFSVISGLAMGIDSAAHAAALTAGGKTIAVLANGLDKVYPAQNEELAQKIVAEGGTIVSEYPAGTPPYKDNFLRRNRIISGLASATIIIEAPARSGALATARFAAEGGREVFVVPGSVNQPNFTGSHKLIRDGARLVASSEDVFEDLGLKLPPEESEIGAESDLTDEEKIIFEAIRSAGRIISVDKLTEITKLQPQVVSRSLTFLIIKDLIKEAEGGYVV